MARPSPPPRFEATRVEEPDGAVHLVETLHVYAHEVDQPVLLGMRTARSIFDAYLEEVPKSSFGLVRTENEGEDGGTRLRARFLAKPLLRFGAPQAHVLGEESRIRCAIRGGFLVARGHERHGFIEFGIGPGEHGGIRFMSRVVGYYPSLRGPLGGLLFRFLQYPAHRRAHARILRRAWASMQEASPDAEWEDKAAAAREESARR